MTPPALWQLPQLSAQKHIFSWLGRREVDDRGLEGCLPPEVSPQLAGVPLPSPAPPESACPNALIRTGARYGSGTSVWAQDRHLISQPLSSEEYSMSADGFMSG